MSIYYHILLYFSCGSWPNYSSREGILKRGDTMVECGSGRSTMWFAGKVKKLISIENHEGWYNEVKLRLQKANILNVDYRYVNYSFEGVQDDSEYVEVICQLADNSVDVCLVDGGPRSYCAIAVIGKLKSGGILIIDDSQVCYPSNTSTLEAIKNESEIPTMWQTTPLSWDVFYALTKDWRNFLTTDGVINTLFLVKP
jgi:hypothetical protein